MIRLFIRKSHGTNDLIIRWEGIEKFCMRRLAERLGTQAPFTLIYMILLDKALIVMCWFTNLLPARENGFFSNTYSNMCEELPFYCYPLAFYTIGTVVAVLVFLILLYGPHSASGLLKSKVQPPWLHLFSRIAKANVLA